jgi:CheY-like chemotaxis protein
MQKRILVVAHAADVVETIPITLELAGHKVELADCGVDAILWAEMVKPDLILVDATLPDMDGAAVIGILRRLPGTAALATLLLKPRGHNPSAQTRSWRRQNSSLNSSKLMQEVAFALALCQLARSEACLAHESEAPDAVRITMTSKSGFTSQTASMPLINVSNN